MTQGEFETLFHSRTVAYQPDYCGDTRPVVLLLGDDIHSRAGHTLIVSLVNQLARAHQHLRVVGAGAEELLCPPLFGLTTVHDATLGLATRINPFIRAGVDMPVDEPLVTLALGTTDARADLHVGADGWCATFGRGIGIGRDDTSVLGAQLAATIAATFCFHRLLGTTAEPERSYSLWDYGARGSTQGPPLRGPVDVGRVLQVGAGGVGAALDYALALVCASGLWTIVDADLVDITNLNRQLSFLAADAGYPDPPAHNKAESAAGLLGPVAMPVPHWLHQAPGAAGAQYDVVLALANDYGARGLLQDRLPPVLLHATTSQNWEAQFHRHVAGVDDCIRCRIPTEGGPAMRCSAAEVNPVTGTDAALPFLSAAAGLLLLAGLLRLQHGALAEGGENFGSLNLKGADAIARQYVRSCSEGCGGWGTPAVRAAIATDTRYASLDPARRSG